MRTTILTPIIRMDQIRPDFDDVILCLSLSGYSVSSLIDNILACRNSEDERIKLLREEMERDAADICARLLCFDPVPKRVLKYGRVQGARLAFSVSHERAELRG